MQLLPAVLALTAEYWAMQLCYSSRVSDMSNDNLRPLRAHLREASVAMAWLRSLALTAAPCTVTIISGLECYFFDSKSQHIHGAAESLADTA